MLHIVTTLLERHNFGHLTDDFAAVFSSHPNFPSLYAITDTLTALDIEHLAVKLPSEHFSELPNEFLAIYDEALVSVRKKKQGVVVASEKSKHEKMETEQFISGWSGVVLAIEPTPEKLAGKTSAKKTGNALLLLPVLLLLVLWLISKKPSLNEAATLGLSLMGLFTGILIIREKLGFGNAITEKFCSGKQSVSCSEVIKSDTLFLGMGFSEVPFVFFAISALAMLMQPSPSSSILGSCALLSLPLVLYSLWLQKFRLKKWCPLCLAVAAVLLLEASLFLAAPFSFSLFSGDYFALAFSVITVLPMWLVAKPNLTEKAAAKLEIEGLRKFKRNYKVFDFLAQAVPCAVELTGMQGLQFGNPAAESKLTLILSPSCIHCHKAFKEGHDLVAAFPGKFWMEVLFNVNPKNIDNPFKEVVLQVLTINGERPQTAREALSDWHIEKKPLKDWLHKWRSNEIDRNAEQQLQRQYDWCFQNGYNYSPVRMINGKVIPFEYSVEELRFFTSNM